MPRLLVGAVLALVATAVFAVPAYAGGARSWVSGGGTDAGTCERTAPCRTFGYAITQTNAKGEVVAIDSSGYGPVTITKAISLIAPKGVHAGISPSSGDAITINAGAADKVVIKNLYLNGGNGALRGIVANAAGTVEVDDTTAAGFTNDGMFLGTNSGNGPLDVSVSDSVTRDNGVHGLHVAGSSGRPMAIEVDHLRSVRNDHHGVLAQSDVRGTVTDSIASHNSDSGTAVGGSAADPVSLGLERVTTAANSEGLFADGDGAKITASNSTIEYNATGLQAVNGGQLVSRVNNTLTENTANGAFTSTIAAAFRAR